MHLGTIILQSPASSNYVQVFAMQLYKLLKDSREPAEVTHAFGLLAPHAGQQPPFLQGQARITATIFVQRPSAPKRHISHSLRNNPLHILANDVGIQLPKDAEIFPSAEALQRWVQPSRRMLLRRRWRGRLWMGFFLSFLLS